jgi:hypothetical protein
MGKNTKLAAQPKSGRLLSFIPTDLVKQAVRMQQSDKHYHIMTTYKQLVFIFYVVISKCRSLNPM